MHVCMKICMCVCVHVRVYICMYACMYVHVRVYVCMYACMYVHVCMCMYVYVCMYVCMYMSVHVLMFVCSLFLTCTGPGQDASGDGRVSEVVLRELCGDDSSLLLSWLSYSYAGHIYEPHIQTYIHIYIHGSPTKPPVSVLFSVHDMCPGIKTNMFWQVLCPYLSFTFLPHQTPMHIYTCCTHATDMEAKLNHLFPCFFRYITCVQASKQTCSGRFCAHT
jgi:hypothetical protein